MFIANFNFWANILFVQILELIINIKYQSYLKSKKKVTYRKKAYVIALMITKRVGWWTEHLKLLDEAGFRKGSFTVDLALEMVSMHEDVMDCKKHLGIILL